MRSPQVRGNQSLAARIEAGLQNLGGVESTKINITTGSVLVRYRQGILDPAMIINLMRRAGALPGIIGLPQRSPKKIRPSGSATMSPTIKKVSVALGQLIASAAVDQITDSLVKVLSRKIL